MASSGAAKHSAFVMLSKGEKHLHEKHNIEEHLGRLLMLARHVLRACIVKYHLLLPLHHL